LCSTRARTRALFPPAVLEQIERECADADAHHIGEIRFAIETALRFAALWHGTTPRARAVQLFAHLHMWDTPHNNGVLIYVLRADRAIEIVADRGISAHVATEEWQAICRNVQTLYGQERYAEGSRAAVAAVAALLIRHFPARDPADAPGSATAADHPPGNDLPIQPILL
jgi:TPM domain